MKAITYARVSSDLQDYTRQNQEIKEYCLKNGIELVAEFSEKESGKKKVRPELTKMIDFSKTNRPEFVIVHELSRLGRTGEVINSIETLNSLGICLISLKENLRTLNPDKTVNATSTLILSVMSSINSFEVDTFKFRSKSGLVHTAKSGKGTGSQHLPFGYTTDEDNYIIPCPIEAPIVKNIFDMYLNGWGCLKIAKYLNAEGVQTKNSKPSRGVYKKSEPKEIEQKKWLEVTVHQVLRNPYYTGKRIYAGNIYEVPAIISEETYLEVKELRKSKINYEQMNKKYDFLLDSRLIVCGVCGLPFYGRKTTREHRYQCRSKRGNFSSCGNGGIQIDKLDKAVTNVIISYFPKFLEQKQDNTKLLNEISTIDTFININNNELKELERSESKLVDLFLSDKVSKDILNTKVEEINRNKKRLNNENEQYIKQISKLKVDLNRRTNFREIAREIKESGISKTLLRSIVSKIVVNESSISLSDRYQDKTMNVTVFVDEFFVTFLITQQTDNFKVIEVYDGKNVPPFDKLIKAFE